MRQCEVLADKISITVNKGSIVNVDDLQYELARKHLKPIESKKAEAKEKKSKK